jgi:hypothetical protein
VDGPRDSRGQHGTRLTALPPCVLHFHLDDATPSAPSLWDNSGYTTACDSLRGLTIGKPLTVYATGPRGTKATVPLSYSYSLNGGSSESVAAGTAFPHAAAFSVTPSSVYNVLTVTAVGPGGNESPATTCDFSAAQPAPEADQDLTGDNIPDLVTVGNDGSGVAPGLWLAAGEGSDGTFNGTINTTATGIAPNGPQDIGSPAPGTVPRPSSGSSSAPVPMPSRPTIRALESPSCSRARAMAP